MHGIIRQSWLTTFEICPRRGMYDSVATEPWSSEVTAIGTAYHAGEEYYYRGRMLGAAVKPSADEMREIHIAATASFRRQVQLPKFTGFTSSYSETLSQVYDLLDAYFVGNHQWGPEYEVMGVELSFRQPFLPGHDAQGTMDLVLRKGDTWLIVDQKTSTRKWAREKESARKNNQSGWYAYWLTRLYPGITLEQIVIAFDIMTRKGEFERRMTYRSVSQVQAVLLKARLVCDVFDSGIELPGNTQSPLCSEVYCAHWDVCPFGSAMDRPTPQPVTITPRPLRSVA